MDGFLVAIRARMALNKFLGENSHVPLKLSKSAAQSLASAISEFLNAGKAKKEGSEETIYAKHRSFICGSAPAWTFSFVAYIGFVNFADARKLLAEIIILLHSKTNTMHHIPRSFIRGLQFTLQLLGRDALFSERANHVNSEKPLCKRQVRIVKDSASGNRVLIAAIAAVVFEEDKNV
jgi:hypothetical protein